MRPCDADISRCSCCWKCNKYLLVALGLEVRPATPVEAGVDINVPGERLLATPLGRTSDGDVEVGLGRGELLGEEAAVSTETLALLLEVSSLELNAATLVHAEHGEPHANDAVLAVDLVLLLGVGGAEGRIERTGESSLTHAEWLLVVELVAARLGLAARRRSRRVVGSLVVTVGADNDNLESILALTDVGSRLLLDILSPESALEAGNGVRLVARALARVPLGVTLDVKVETSAGGGRVTLGGASSSVVAGKLVVSEVTAALNGGAEVYERRLVTGRSLSGGSQLVVNLVLLESIGSVGSGWWAVGVGLSSTWVIRVDETTVGADLDLSSACGVCGESVGVGPVNRGARRWCKVGRRRVGGRRSGGSRSRGNGRSRSRLVVLSLVPVPPEGRVTSLKLGTDAPLCLLGSSNASGSSSGGVLSLSLVVSALSSDTSLWALSNVVGQGVELVDIESLRRWRSGYEGSSPKEEGVTHIERLDGKVAKVV